MMRVHLSRDCHGLSNDAVRSFAYYASRCLRHLADLLQTKIPEITEEKNEQQLNPIEMLDVSIIESYRFYLPLLGHHEETLN